MTQASDLQIVIEIVLFIIVGRLMTHVVRHEWRLFKKLFR